VLCHSGFVAVDETALIVTVPEADPLVAVHRRRFDSGAIRGVPAHVTVLYPFMPVTTIDDDVLDDLRRLFATRLPFGVRFAVTRWLGERVVTLAPEPEHPFRDLTTAVADRWPDYPPYEGAFDDVVPHLTLGDFGDTDQLRIAVDEVVTGLPIETEVFEVALWRGNNGVDSWRPVTSFPLGG